MNPSDPENPLLTRYVLDDLTAVERAELEGCLQNHPLLAQEVQQLQEVADALRAEAPIHELRLSAPQRAKVLQGPPRRPVPAPRVMRSTSSSPLAGMLRLAASITLLAGAFLLGRYQGSWPNDLASSGVAMPDATPESEVMDTPPQVVPMVASHPTHVPQNSDLVVAHEPPNHKSEEPAPAESAVTKAAEAEAEPAKGLEVVETLSGSLPGADKLTSAGDQALAGVTVTAARAAMVNAHRQPLDQSMLQPRLLRPKVERESAQLAAKPLSAGDRKSAAESQARRKPALHIHSWSHETASCPWNAQRRLLKVTIQLPADQEAVALGENEYPVEVIFDANHVREYRRLGARYQPALELRRAGTQTLWYEFLPNGKPAEAFENGKLIATVRLPGAKFTTQAVGPFDASRLQVLDRGRSWQQLRGDFVFDTAVLAMALLLDGDSHSGAVNQPLVLELAEAARAAGDPDGSRGRFIEAVRQVGRLAGR